MRLVRRLLLALLLLTLTAVGALYALSSRALARMATAEVPPFTHALPTDSAAIAEGERLARTRGCLGCHGERLEGEVFFEERGVARVVAPNLTALAARVDDATLERAIRHGIGADGRALFGMPAEMYRVLTDEDLARLLAWLRTLPEAPDTLGTSRLGPVGRIGLLTGQFQPSRHYIATETIPPPPADPVLRAGHYIAWSSCTECHGGELEGDGFGSPALRPMMDAYTVAELGDFFRTGLAKGGRELRMMSGVARGRLRHLRDDEVAALHAYIRSLPVPGTPAPPAAGAARGPADVPTPGASRPAPPG